jgi:hypothetical protein
MIFLLCRIKISRIFIHFQLLCFSKTILHAPMIYFATRSQYLFLDEIAVFISRRNCNIYFATRSQNLFRDKIAIFISRRDRNIYIATKLKYLFRDEIASQYFFLNLASKLFIQTKLIFKGKKVQKNSGTFFPFSCSVDWANFCCLFVQTRTTFCAVIVTASRADTKEWIYLRPNTSYKHDRYFWKRR